MRQKSHPIAKSPRQRHPRPASASGAATLDRRARQSDPVDELTDTPVELLPSDDHAWADVEASDQAVDELRAFTPDDDPVRRYLRDMGAYRRLTFAEEVALAKRIEAGRPGSKRKLPAATSHARVRTANQSAAAETGWTAALDPDGARAHMIQANLRLVVSVAKQFAGRGLSLPDLIQEGNLGLMKAAERFDWRRMCRIGTHAANQSAPPPSSNRDSLPG